MNSYFTGSAGSFAANACERRGTPVGRGTSGTRPSEYPGRNRPKDGPA